MRWEDVSKRATKKAPHPAEPLVVDGDDACGASDNALSDDSAFGTLFSIVKMSEVHTPGASRSASLRSSASPACTRAVADAFPRLALSHLLQTTAYM